MLDPDLDPTPRQVRVFGALVVGFAAVVSGLALGRPQALLGAAVMLGAAWLVSLIFSAEHRRRPLLGGTLPVGFALTGGLVRAGIDARAVAAVLVAAGLVTATVVWSRPAAGRRLYVAWMRAAAPLGFTFSHLVLAVVYYAVLTPIGLVLRLAGRDPLQRRFDRQATTYWIERQTAPDPTRPFKQF